MFLQLYEYMVQFLQENLVLVGLIMAITEYLKRWLQTYPWYKGWMATLIAFVLGFLMVIPADLNIVWLEFVASGIGLGLVATGLYKVSETIIRKS